MDENNIFHNNHSFQWNNTYFDHTLIDDIKKCNNFFHNLGIIKGKKTDKELINDFIKEYSKMKDLALSFKNYINNFDKIKELLKEW